MSNEAQQAEAQNTKEATVEFRGQRFTVPREYADWPLELHEAYEDGKGVSILRAALGPQQWATVRGMGLKTADINELADAVAGSMGFRSMGESEASSD